jgi:class 3 adenylate cyclase
MARLYFSLILFCCLFTSVLHGQSAKDLFKEGKTLRAEGKNRKAIEKFESALDLAKKERNTELQMNAHVELAELKDNVVNYKEALNHYKEFSTLYKKLATEKTKQLEQEVTGLKTEVDSTQSEMVKKDSAIAEKESEIKAAESAIDSLTTEQLKSQLAIKDLEIANHQKELQIQEDRNRRNFLLFVAALSLLLVVFVAWAYIVKRKGVRVLSQKNRQIVEEKQKSEKLLLNILPETIAHELKEHGKTRPQRHENATVMFTDFEGFTKFSEKHSPEDLVHLVDHYFQAFDQVMHKYHIEKIKTIGDAYMCVAGIPESKENHAALMIQAAFEFREIVQQVAEEKQKSGQPFLQMRIGIHSGPLVAGVVGTKKFAYDVWGDSVNIAARMEQHSVAGSINVSESVYLQTKDLFDFEYRGEMEAKNKGKMKMYFVKARVAEAVSA